MLAVQSTNALDELPLRAQLAYAARCARRVINLFRLPSNHPEFARCCKSLGGAIRLAESFAAGIDVDAEELAQVEGGALCAVTASSEMQPSNERAAYAANSAYAAFCAVKAAVASQGAGSSGGETERFAQAVMLARDAAIAADDSVARIARADWELLGRMQLGRFPDFGEAVDPAENGALGPLFKDLSRGGADGNKAKLLTAGRRVPAEMAGTSLPGLRAEQLAEIEGLRKQFDADRKQFQADRAAFDAEKQALQMQLFKELAKLDRERQKLQCNQQAIEHQSANSESHETQLASQRARLETREHELAAHCAAVETREHELQVRQAELESREEELTSHLAGIEALAIQLEAEKNATRAAFESLGEERREFLEERLRWVTTSTKS